MREQEALLNISEPFDISGVVVDVVIQCQITMDDTPALLVKDNGQWLVLFTRYRDEQIEEIWQGKTVIVNIAKIESGSPQDKLESGQIEFFAIGSVKLKV